MERAAEELPSHFYPHFPDEEAFIALLSVAIRNGAEGYVLIDPDRWYVIGFASTQATVAPVQAGELVYA